MKKRPAEVKTEAKKNPQGAGTHLVPAAACECFDEKITNIKKTAGKFSRCFFVYIVFINYIKM